MARKYEQQLRADTAEETRRRILDAVAQRLRDRQQNRLALTRSPRLHRWRGQRSI